MNTPKWLIEARLYSGQSEVAGPKSNDWIINLWATIPWIWNTVARKDDSLLPWCGAFVRYCLVAAGVKPPKNWFRAREYVDFGTKLPEPVVGAIGVILTGKQWHVGFIEGVTTAGWIVMRGGNQNDAVKLSAFKPEVFQAYVWPEELTGTQVHDLRYPFLPVINVSASTKQT